MEQKKFYEMVIGVAKDDLESAVHMDRREFIPLNAETREILFSDLEICQRFAYRGHCENDDTFKQLIPYCIVTRGDEVFAFRRLPESGEKRLVGKYSIGVGGHMNPARYGIDPIPATFADVVKENMLRELDEELNIQCPKDKPMLSQVVGLINSEADSVSSVHVAIVVHVILPLEATVEVAEKDTLEGKFLSPEDRQPLAQDEMELWTKIAMGNYITNIEGREWFELS